MTFNLRTHLTQYPADEQPPEALILRGQELMDAVADQLGPYPKIYGASSEDADLRLELSSPDRRRRVVIQLGPSIEYIYYAYEAPNHANPCLSKSHKPVTPENLLWVLTRVQLEADKYEPK